MITYKLANEIVEQTMLRLHRNVNVINIDGIILASGDKERIEKVHEGAKAVVSTKQPLIITTENIKEYPQTKPGINLPILFQDEIVCIIGITGEVDDELINISSLVQLTVEVMVHQALIESKSEWLRKMSVHIFEELISGTPVQGLLKEQMKKLGIPFEAPYCVLLLKAQQKSGSHRTLIQYLEDFFYNQPVLYGHFQLNEYYVLATEISDYSLLKMMDAFSTFIFNKFDIEIGVGKIVNQLDELPESYRTAQLAMHHCHKNCKITYFKDIEIYSLFQTKPANDYSLKLLNLLEPKLIETLQIFLHNNLTLISTAEQLHIHRHTLTYRLSQIKQKTGLNPHNFQDAIKFQIALWNRSINNS
ncbi:MAG: sugar diacid recognition domain-containing protein [Solibacillus sp.]|uniref:CdaR family transcriptional regulator n=1 Tax=unclassified Solibacillus TaxID=2637870 RepID=UPI0030F55EB2